MLRCTKTSSFMVAILVICKLMKQQNASSYVPQHNNKSHRSRNDIESRRNVLSKLGRWTIPIASGAIVSLPPVAPTTSAYAKESSASQSVESDTVRIREATEALTSLLENWESATVDCTYADVPRDLLEAKNKEKLLEKASEFALFDKSTSVISCKKTNRIVRDYIGATGKGPLVGLEKRLLKTGVVGRVDPDSLDDYFTAVDSFSQAISRAKSLSYTAGMADFDSVNNFERGNESASGESSNLEQARKAIDEANSYLRTIVSLFSSDDS